MAFLPYILVAINVVNLAENEWLDEKMRMEWPEGGGCVWGGGGEGSLKKASLRACAEVNCDNMLFLGQNIN